MEQPIDVRVVNDGSIFLFVLETEAAREWVDENVPDATFWAGNALVVEHRFAGNLACGIERDGLVIR